MCLVIINSYAQEKVITKYFTIHLTDYYLFRFSNEIRLTLFNDFIALVSSYKLESSFTEEMTDFEVDISANIQTFTNVEIDLNSKGHIENIIFGYIFNRTEIIKYNEGLKLKSTLRDEMEKSKICHL